MTSHVIIITGIKKERREGRTEPFRQKFSTEDLSVGRRFGYYFKVPLVSIFPKIRTFIRRKVSPNLRDEKVWGGGVRHGSHRSS